MNPYFFIAIFPYSEQLGWNLHFWPSLFSFGEMFFWCSSVIMNIEICSSIPMLESFRFLDGVLLFCYICWTTGGAFFKFGAGFSPYFHWFIWKIGSNRRTTSATTYHCISTLLGVHWLFFTFQIVPYFPAFFAGTFYLCYCCHSLWFYSFFIFGLPSLQFFSTRTTFSGHHA